MKVILTILIICSLYSCSTQKHITTTVTHSDSSFTHTIDSLQRVIKTTIAKYEYVLKQNQLSRVEFDTLFLPGDTVHNTITIHEDGSIEASGKIKAAYVQKEKIQHDLTVLKSKYDSLTQVKNKVETKVITDTVTKEKVVKRSFIPFWVWIIISALGILYVYEKFIKK